MSILEGSIVFVDDDYRKKGTNAKAFYDELQTNGRPVAAYNDVPNITHLDHWDGLALAVLDWDLSRSEGESLGATVPQAAIDAKRDELIAFLVTLLDRYFCPVFIVSQHNKDKIEAALRSDANFPDTALTRRVHVLEKDANDLLPRLEKIVMDDPVLSTFRIWEQQYQRGKNRMFIELDALDTGWLVYISQIAADGGTEYGYELVETLYGNLRHRVDPGAFNEDGIKDIPLPDDSDARRKVIHGRTVLPKDALHASTIMPGDFFGQWKTDGAKDVIWLNITPACDTVLGRKKAKDIRMYLLRGTPADVSADGTPQSLREARLLDSNSVIIDVMHDGNPYRFPFRSLEIVTYDKLESHRLGRVLPPYITDAQERHAMYLLREGLPAVLPTLYARSTASSAGDQT